MAIEPRRGCGYRKVGGLYMVSGVLAAPCCKMPILMHVCPTCNNGIKQSRGWQWIDPRPWVAGDCKIDSKVCPLAKPAFGDKVGLIWIGAQFYPTPAHFLHEANTMGVSRRIKAVPRGFEVGKHWVFLAHPRVKQDPDTGEWQGGVFAVFRPTAIEKIITESESTDEAFMAKLIEAGIEPVVVPDNDPDHRGTAYDLVLEPEFGKEAFFSL